MLACIHKHTASTLTVLVWKSLYNYVDMKFGRLVQWVHVNFWPEMEGYLCTYV